MARYDDLNDYNWLLFEIERHEMWQAIALGKLLYDKLNPKLVIDIGTGPGIYLLYFKSRGCGVLGIDGASAGGKYLDKDEFLQLDLRNPSVVPYQGEGFDLGLCIEVAEHIPPQYADTLMDTVCATAKNVFFSAAHPGQGGESHLNEQPEAYWIEKFEDRGFEEHPLSDEIHAVIVAGDEYEHCHWLKWQSFLMRRKEK